MRVLVTAFEPFGGADSNITQSVLSLLPDSIADWAIEKVCLPVSFKRAPIVLREAITTYSPDLVIMLGQCPAGENIRLERFAINMRTAQKAIMMAISRMKKPFTLINHSRYKHHCQSRS